MLPEQAFLGEFLRVERLLAAHLRCATGDFHAAEDLLQTVAAVLWTKRVEFDATRPFAAWALGVTQLEVLKWRQRTARSREVLSADALHRLSEVANEHVGEADDRYFFLAECLQGLSDSARRVLRMKYAEGLKICDIASGLARSVAAVEMMLVRSRRELRECIERKMARNARDFS